MCKINTLSVFKRKASKAFHLGVRLAANRHFRGGPPAVLGKTRLCLSRLLSMGWRLRHTVWSPIPVAPLSLEVKSRFPTLCELFSSYPFLVIPQDLRAPLCLSGSAHDLALPPVTCLFWIGPSGIIITLSALFCLLMLWHWRGARGTCWEGLSHPGLANS